MLITELSNIQYKSASNISQGNFSTGQVDMRKVGDSCIVFVLGEGMEVPMFMQK